MKFDESRLNLTTNFDLIYIIGKWCDRIEEYIQRYNSSNQNKISKELYEDYVEFNRNERSIFKVFDDMSVNIIYLIIDETRGKCIQSIEEYFNG